MIAVLQKGSEDVKITHIKIRNYRNLRNIDIGSAETVTIIGENNSGKSNFLKAITLPFLTDDNTHISKKLSWTDINNESKKWRVRSVYSFSQMTWQHICLTIIPRRIRQRINFM